MWDLKCIAAALCFLTSNTLFIVNGAIMMKGHNHNSQSSNANGDDGSYDPNSTNKVTANWNFQSWKELDPSYIQERWLVRDEQRPIMMSAALFGALAWFWLMVPIIQSAWVLSRGGKRLVGPHMLLAALAVCGSIIELLARLMTVGMTNASQWLARDFNLDNWYEEGDGTGWRVLEMIHMITRGMLLWVDAFEAMALFGIVVILFYSVASEPKFKTKRSSSIVVNSETEDGADAVDEDDNAPSSSAAPPASAFAGVTTKVPIEPTFSKCFVWYGLFIGLLAVVDFLADVLRFIDWKLFGRIALATDALLGVLFLPIWILLLGRQLPAATERFERNERRASILVGARDDEVASLKGSGGEMS